MSDNPSNNNAPSMGQLLNALMPYFKEGQDRPSVFSAEDMNKLVRILRGVRAMKFNCTTVDAQEGGSYTPTARVKWGDENLIIDLGFPPGSDATGSSSAQLAKVISYTPGNDYVVCQIAVATSSNNFSNSGSNFNVALPFKLRQYNNFYSAPSYDPPYVANDILLITQPIGGTGVFVSSTDVGWVDLNYDAREWLKEDYFEFGTMYSNYFSATSVTSGNTVNILRPWDFLTSSGGLITAETIDSNAFTYTYGASSPFTYVARLADCSALSINEYQVIVPRYLSTSIIKARAYPTGMVDGSSNPILWQEVSGREWCTAANQSGYE